MPQNLIWLVKWSDRYWEPSIHPQGQFPRAAPAGGFGIQPRKPHGDRLKGGEAVASLAHMPAVTHSAFQCSMAVNIQPQPSSTVNTRAVRAPHEVGGMGDDLTDMGISATAAAAMGREQVVLVASPGAPACGKHGCHDRPEAEPRPCGVPRPPRGMPPGRPRWPLQASSEIEGFGPRRFAGGRSAA